MTSHKKSQEWFLRLSKSTKNATLSELQGASLPRPPPGLCAGPTEGLTATPRPPAEFSNDLWSLHVVPEAQLPQDWEFFLFSYWGWDFELFKCWEMGSEPSLQDPRRKRLFHCSGRAVTFELLMTLILLALTPGALTLLKSAG